MPVTSSQYWELVVVGVGVVEEPVLLDEQPARIDARPVPAVPPLLDWPLADGLLQRADGHSDVLALLLLSELIMAGLSVLVEGPRWRRELADLALAQPEAHGGLGHLNGAGHGFQDRHRCVMTKGVSER